MHYLLSLFVHKKIQKKNDKKTEKGFILILTMLIVSVVLSISLSIFTITIKELVLSQYLAQSERAFVAADKAIECALFWDRALPAQTWAGYFTPFSTSTEYSFPPSINNVVCGPTGVSSPASGRLNLAWGTPLEIDADSGRTEYTIVYTDGSSADVVVEKDGINTTVTSNGYNTSDSTSARRTQRTIVARYNL
jgi:hypothetical protein